MRPATSSYQISLKSSSRQKPRLTTPLNSSSHLIESFVHMRNTVQDVERRNRQFMESIKANEISRSNRALSRSRSSRQRRFNPQTQSSEITSRAEVNLKLEVQRLNNKLIQQKRSKELLEEQLSLVEARCERQKSKFQRVDKEYKSKVNAVKVNVAKQLSEFSEVVRDMFWKIDRKNNRNKQILDDLNLKLRKDSRSKFRTRSKSKREVDQGFKKKADDNKFLVEIGEKYQKLFLGKNEELESLQERVKGKDREIKELKMLVDKLHQKEKEESLRNSSLIEELKGKVEAIERKEEVFVPLRKKQSRESGGSGREREMGVESDVYQLKLQLKEKTNSLGQFITKVTGLEKLLEERSSTMQMLQRDLSSQKSNKSELLVSYQQAVQRNKSQYKGKLQHILLEVQELKSTIVRKETQLHQTQEREDALLNKCSEMETELSVMGQKLLLREELFLRPIETKEDSMSISRNSSILIPEQDQMQFQNLRKENRLLLLEKQQMRIEISRLEETKRRLESEAQTQAERKFQTQQSNKSLKSQILQLQKEILSLTKQQNLLSSSTPKTMEQLQIQAKILQSKNDELERQNVQINSQLIRYQHDLKLSTDLEKILESQVSSAKSAVKESEMRLLKQEGEIGALNKIVALQKDEIAKLKTQEGVIHETYKEELYGKSVEIERMNGRILELEKAQRETEEGNDIRIRLQLRNNNLSEDLQEARNEVSKLKADRNQQFQRLKEKFQQSMIKNIQNQQTIKFQSSKISEIQQKLYSSHQVGGQLSNLTNKIKSLQQLILQFQINKANYQRQLQESQKLRDNIKQENTRLQAQTQRIKSQCTNLILKNEEKLEQKDNIIKAFELSLKQRDRVDASGSKISVEKSGFSNSYLSPTDFDASIDFNFDITQKLPHALEKLHFKRKSHVMMMEKIQEYIGNLKGKIDEQAKVIRMTNRRIEAFRNGDFEGRLAGKELGGEEKDEGEEEEKELRTFEVTSLKEVNLNRKHTRRIRALENQKQLLLEENNILQRQVTALQDELVRADEEEKNYIRMKQIYKEEISRQRKAIEEKNQAMKKLSEDKEVAFANSIEDCGKVFVKIMTIIFSTQRVTFAKKSQMEEYIRVITCLLSVDSAIANWMIQEIKR